MKPFHRNKRKQLQSELAEYPYLGEGAEEEA